MVEKIFIYVGSKNAILKAFSTIFKIECYMFLFSFSSFATSLLLRGLGFEVKERVLEVTSYAALFFAAIAISSCYLWLLYVYFNCTLPENRRKNGCCERCGYNLNGVGNECPECGSKRF